MRDRFLLWPIFFMATIVIGAAIDQFAQPWGQYFVDVLVWFVFLLLIKTSEPRDRRRFIACLVLATLGEIVLCHFLQLYEYREKNIPLFVPPGHVLLYATGLALATRAPRKLWLAVLIGGLVYSAWSLIHTRDQLSLILFTLWCVIVLQKPVRALVSVMFLLALAMELMGTAFGNWAWAPRTPFLFFNVTIANPPFAAGVFYCGLDFLIAMLII